MYVYLSGNAINIYCVSKLDPIASSRDDTFTVQNALFGAMQITKMLILQNITIKDMVYVLMKEVILAILLEKVVLIILQTLETF